VRATIYKGLHAEALPTLQNQPAALNLSVKITASKKQKIKGSIVNAHLPPRTKSYKNL
jgi:hypothetical protein